MSYLSSHFVVSKNGNESKIMRKDLNFSSLVERLEQFLADGYEIAHLHTKIRCAND